MGLPITASYILMAILCVPSLVLLGAPTVQAHLLVFWLAMTFNVTPSVCVTAFAAASLAKASPMRTGFNACKLASLLYIMPFTFAYRPSLMLLGTNFGYSYFCCTVCRSLLCAFRCNAGLAGAQSFRADSDGAFDYIHYHYAARYVVRFDRCSRICCTSVVSAENEE